MHWGHEIDDLDLSRYVREGDTVLWGQACAEPRSLTARLFAQRSRIGKFRCFLGIPATTTVLPEYADQVTFLSYTGSGANRELHRAGVLDVLPCHYSQLPSLIAAGTLPVDVVLLLLPPPDRDGNYSMGLSEDYLSAAVDAARVVIAEVSEEVPWTYSSRRLAPSDVDVVVHTSTVPAEVVREPPDPVARRIAAHVAGLVEDGATLQIGLGALPEAVLSGLAGHRDLGVHSGLVGDGVASLMETGVITNARKAFDRGSTIGGMLAGSRRLFQLADRNQAIQLRDTGYTHDPDLLAAQHRFVAINSAIEVDLTGQINAEVAAGTYVGAVGGSLDFLRGAARAPGGLPIVVIPSNRIVPTLSGPVTTSRADAGIIVTEHGIADLRGQPLSVRRDRLIAIADPDRRADLET